MRLLLFSDIHCDLDAAHNLVSMARDVEAVVGAGDFATMRRGLDQVMGVLAKIECPTILVPGNAESYEELLAATKEWPAAQVLHGSGTHLEGLEVWGVGGAIPITPFGAWSYDFSEDDAQLLLADCPSEALLVTHSPPRGLVDKTSSGEHLGSRAVLETVERCRPKLVVCGHIHHCAGRRETLSTSTIINAGPRGVWWDLPS